MPLKKVLKEQYSPVYKVSLVLEKFYPLTYNIETVKEKIVAMNIKTVEDASVIFNSRKKILEEAEAYEQ